VFSEINKKKTNMYYKHSHGCGSGRTTILSVIKETNMLITYKSQWMGSESLHFSLDCTLYPISGKYYVAKVNSFTEINKDGNKLYPDMHYFFDVYLFDEVLDTEWAKYPIEDIPISLYAGYGCHSTNKFRLLMVENKGISSGVFDVDRLVKIVNSINNTKYEQISQEDYEKYV